MKARPILFSAPMVLALLEGRKTQTRRIIKLKTGDTFDEKALVAAIQEWRPVFDRVAGCHVGRESVVVKCPYGKPGDVLWARESGKIVRDAYDINPITNRDLWRDVGWVHAADDTLLQREMLATTLAPLSQWIGDCVQIGRPSIHMPRWASRLTLQITDVRVERLQEISDADAVAEGISEYPDGFHWQPNHGWPGEAAGAKSARLVGATARQAYFGLWEEINGRASLDADPWLWCVSFTVHQQNVDVFMAAQEAA